MTRILTIGRSDELRPPPLLLMAIAFLAIACGEQTVLPTGSTAPSAAATATTLATTARTEPPKATPSAAPVLDTPAPTPKLSAAESQLLTELRADSRIGCVPRRKDLPPGSNVGVECHLDSDLVDRVGVYGFPANDGLGTQAIGAYMARMEDQGIALGSGDCSAGIPGDASWPGYLPDEGPEGAGPSETRLGCFHDENGRANIRLTCYGEVYIGILGKGRDIEELDVWTTRVAAGESTQRDPPGICARPD